MFQFSVHVQLQSRIDLRYSTGQQNGELNDVASRKKKGKCKEGEFSLEFAILKEGSQENRLTTLDIFAGCGGLSEGLEQSGSLSLAYATLHFSFIIPCKYNLSLDF